jgi:mitogen-activated protein kinase 1/3
VNANCDIALTDFGLSRGLSGGAKEDLTEYVVTRNYRSPELLCDSSRYGKSVDIWSVGCIFLEIICRKRSLFIGKSPFHQLASIIETVGCPPCDELDFVEHPVIRDMITTSRNKVKQGEDPLRRMLPNNVEPEALDLLKKMLVVKPEDR